jgi:hypothetical protein
LSFVGLTAPSGVAALRKKNGSERSVEITWNTAFAGDMPLAHYEIWRDGSMITSVNHKPQTTKVPFLAADQPGDDLSHEYSVVVTDMAGRSAKSEPVRIAAI